MYGEEPPAAAYFDSAYPGDSPMPKVTLNNARTSLCLLRSCRFAASLVAVLLMFLSSPCLGQPEDEDTPARARIPNTKAGQELKWVLDVVNGGSVGDPADKFTTRFIEMVSAEGIKASLSSLREKSFGGEKIVLLRVLANDERGDTISAIVKGENNEHHLAVFLILDEKTGKIAGLRFAPAGGLGGGPGDIQSFNAVAADLDRMPGGVSFGAYEVVAKDLKDPKAGYRLREVYEFGEDKRLAIGSTFKLYVLGALAEQVARGEAKWDEKLAVKNEARALPSGVMFMAPPEAEYPLSKFADLMISISDNTAAGQLMLKVGRGRVEEYMAGLNAEPSRTRPFLTPREMFIIKLNRDRSLADRYANADEDTKRVMLAEGGEVAKGGLDFTRVKEWKDPMHIDDIEWFATAPECCRVMADLHRLEQLPGMEPLGHALRMNSGIPFDKETWKSVAFKGGSEPGVLNLTWLMERNDGKWYALSVGWNDTKKTVDQNKLVELAQKGVAILEKDGKEDRKNAKAEPVKAEKPAPKKAEGPRELNDGK